MAVFGPDGTVLSTDSGFAALMELPGGRIDPGTTIEEILHRPLADLGEDLDAQEDRVSGEEEGPVSELVVASGKKVVLTRIALSDGGFILRCEPAWDRNLQHADEAIRSLMDSAIDNMAGGIRIFDRDFRLVFFNKLAVELSRYPEHFFRPGTPYETFLGYSESREEYIEDTGVVAERLRRAKEGESRSREQTLVDGRVIRKTRKVLPGGGLVSTYTDITELKKTQEEASRRAEFIRIVVESINHGVRAIGPDGNLLLWNKRYQDIFRYPDRFLQAGISYSEITRFNSTRAGRSTEEVEARVQRRLKRNRLSSRLNRVKRYRDDLVIHQNTEPLPGGGFITTYTDITELAHTQDQLVREKQRAEFANRSKTEFLANMSHELRTPLNAIIGFSEILHQEVKGPLGAPEYKEYAADILESGSLLLELIDDILDLSKIETGQVRLDRKPTDVAEVIRSCLIMTRARAQQEGVGIELALAERLPGLEADSRMLKQVLLNLLSNAIKFTEAGGRVRISADLDEAGHFVLTVADTGIGIPEDKIAAALEPFTQIEHTLTKRHTGSGLGLSIAKSLVECHGGEFLLESALGEGTNVTIRLPPDCVLSGEE